MYGNEAPSGFMGSGKTWSGGVVDTGNAVSAVDLVADCGKKLELLQTKAA
jgi:hypothetical protein